MLGAIKRHRYEKRMSEFIEFSSFLVSALITGQDQFLGGRKSPRWRTAQQGLFALERTQDKPAILRECFDVRILPSDVPCTRILCP